MKALSLLPFVDQPTIGIRRIQEVVTSLKIRSYQLRDVATALGHSRCAEALGALQALVTDEANANLLGDAWINAVAALDTAESRQILLGLVDPEVPALSFAIKFDRQDVVAARLVELAPKEKTIERRLLDLCSTKLGEPRRSLLAKVIAELGTPEADIASLNLLDDLATPQIPSDTFRQMEAAFVERRPYGKDANAFTLSPRSSNEVRAQLFEMANGDKDRMKSAAALLAQIETWRLEHGRPNGEPRSMEVACQPSWPTVAVTRLRPDRTGTD